eukprot:s2505_g5.t1
MILWCTIRFPMRAIVQEVRPQACLRSLSDERLPLNHLLASLAQLTPVWAEDAADDGHVPVPKACSSADLSKPIQLYGIQGPGLHEDAGEIVLSYTVTKSVVEAPKLAEPSEASAIDFGDWVHCLENVMGDLSTNSGEWWRAVLEDAQDYYRKYMEEDQFARLMLKPVASPEVADSKWMRVDRRGAALIMSAVPDEVKRELVAARTPEDELKVTRTAEVILAGDQKMEFPQTQSGVILAGPEAQPIVPLGSLIRDVRVYNRSSCPEVRECDALRTAIQMSKQRQPCNWWDAVKRYVTEGTRDAGNQAVMAAPFMGDVPVELRTQASAVEKRALWKSDAWVVHMFSGDKFKGDPLQYGPGELLELDLRRGTSLINPEVYGVLLWAAKNQKIKHMIGGPPSRTFSPIRGRDNLKTLEVVRSAEELWGVSEGLQWEDRVAMETDAATKAMSAKERKEWKEHLNNNHFPYRRDCSVCLQASRTGRPARKVEPRDAFVLSLDVAGPFATRGVDENRGSKHRFKLVGSYTFPKIKEIPAEEEPAEEEQPKEEFFQMDEPDADEGVDLPEDPSLDEQEREWERTVGELTKPVEIQTLKFCVPMEFHRGREVLDAVQSFYLDLRARGIPLNRIHSDRGREFRVKPLRCWCRERDIAQTFIEGLKPTQNGSAENCVRWFKSQARLLLVAGGLDKKFWPGVMKAAADRYNRRQLGWKPPPMKFGQVVWVKSKKELGPFDPRWECGRYMGPADDVREDHVVRLDDGTWMRTLSMRIMRDEEYEEQAEDDEGEYVVDHIEPGRRVRGKTTLRDLEIRAMAVASLSRPELVRRILSSDMWTSSEARVTRPQIKEGCMWDGAAYVSVGAYQYGGRNGVTNTTYVFPEVTAWATEILKRDHPGCEFSSIALLKNVAMPIHRDDYNLKGGMNLISPLSVTRGSAIWEELKVGDAYRGKYMAKRKGGKDLPGQLLSVEKPAKVNPARYHEPVLGDDGDRILVVGYTVSKWFKLEGEMQQELEELGFVLPKENAIIKAVNWLEPQTEPAAGTTSPTTTQANPQSRADYESYVEQAEWDPDVDGQNSTLRNPGMDIRDVEVYTAAANAESVRCALALASHRQWDTAVWDINSAFTLIPMTESDITYAITVPRVITDSGCVGTDKAYILERVLHGLREAPRLWGGFRDRRISRAVLYYKGEKCRFVPMHTDPAAWRLCAERDQEGTLALMVIYIDDVIFLGNEEVIQLMCDWLTQGRRRRRRVEVFKA